MRIAFIIYNGMTLLDFAGVFDPVTRLKTMGFTNDLDWDICAPAPEIRTTEGAVLRAGRVSNDLSGYDYVIVPGGDGIRDLLQDQEFLRWIAVRPPAVAVSVCGGSILLGAAGLLRDRKAATHPQLRGFLSRLCREVSADRIVDEGGVITAGGVTAAIDLGLYLCEKIAGKEARKKIQEQMDYRQYCTP